MTRTITTQPTSAVCCPLCKGALPWIGQDGWWPCIVVPAWIRYNVEEERAVLERTLSR
ncbi:hypothetical protein [Trinickia sp. Y13]|uniref:hypothetical protein n=1 Tax=Trinickia sp. Y13 TaxID=2917807 RepID=UPI00240505C2|nr:hypothetical protein [Trinickia sp. Y13]MDG0025505.1 hypothetical protein [Trinickia sp. Y13]